MVEKFVRRRLAGCSEPRRGERDREVNLRLIVLEMVALYNNGVSNNKSFFMDKSFLCGRERVLLCSILFSSYLEKMSKC